MENIFEFITIEFKVIFTAMLPIIELRGAIPIGIALGLSPWHSAILGFLGSMIPVPFILFGVRPVFNFLKNINFFRGIIDKITSKSLNKSKDIQKYGAIGLLIFVAIPLPGTGVWSGSLIAALLNLRFKLAFPSILFGNAIAGLIITTMSYGAFRLLF